MVCRASQARKEAQAFVCAATDTQLGSQLHRAGWQNLRMCKAEYQHQAEHDLQSPG